MELPKLIGGKRFTLPRPAGSADALLLAQLAQRETASHKITAIVTSDATDAQRLLEKDPRLTAPAHAGLRSRLLSLYAKEWDWVDLA